MGLPYQHLSSKNRTAANGLGTIAPTPHLIQNIPTLRVNTKKIRYVGKYKIVLYVLRVHVFQDHNQRRGRFATTVQYMDDERLRVQIKFN
jgi:hypothetical protein